MFPIKHGSLITHPIVISVYADQVPRNSNLHLRQIYSRTIYLPPTPWRTFIVWCHGACGKIFQECSVFWKKYEAVSWAWLLWNFVMVGYRKIIFRGRSAGFNQDFKKKKRKKKKFKILKSLTIELTWACFCSHCTLSNWNCVIEVGVYGGKKARSVNVVKEFTLQLDFHAKGKNSTNE